MSNSHCLNCGTPLEGPYCHACGQPVKGMIRHFRSVVGDFLDTVFEYDSRIWRTLLPLYLVPGRLTLDFVAGRRIRFVTPFRLAFVLLVVALLVLQLTVTEVDPLDDAPGITDATSMAALEAARDRALAEVEQAEAALQGETDSGALARQRGLEQARQAVQREVERRAEWLRAVEEARAAGREPPPEPSGRAQIYFGEDTEPWDPETNPVVVAWLPDFANVLLNQWLERAVDNLEAAQHDPGRFIDAFLGLLPVALFVLLPVFALLLKLFYVSSGRLYMEHMVVALHSHAFFGLAIIVATALELLAEAAPQRFGLGTATDFLHGTSLAWIPVYILIMQRRVYAQGWVMTLLKFSVLGLVYLLLLALAMSMAALVVLIQG